MPWPSEHGVPRSNFLQFNTDRDRNDADLVTERLTHRATPWLTLTNDTRAGFYSRYFQYTTIDRCDTTAATTICATRLVRRQSADRLWRHRRRRTL